MKVFITLLALFAGHALAASIDHSQIKNPLAEKSIEKRCNSKGDCCGEDTSVLVGVDSEGTIIVGGGRVPSPWSSADVSAVVICAGRSEVPFSVGGASCGIPLILYSFSGGSKDIWASGKPSPSMMVVMAAPPGTSVNVAV